MEIEERIKKGLEGKFTGLSNGFTRINQYIFNFQRACYYLLGGMSGTYKTTLADFMLLSAISDADAKGIKLDVFYYSYEIDKLNKQCNWLSVLIYQKYNIIIPPEKIKCLGDNRLTEEELKLVTSELEEVKKLFERINFRFVSTNPTGVFHELCAHGNAIGTVHYEKVKNAKGEDVLDDSGNVITRVSGYTPNNPDAYTIVVLDHLYHLKKEREFGVKEIIDKYSEYCVQLRNLFGFSFINIQQFNDGLSSVERAKFKGVDLSPQMTDFRDSRNAYMDADVVFGTMCPFKMDMTSCMGYDITRLKSDMIMLKIIKNRLSKDNIAVGLYCNPKAGSFIELPPSFDMTDQEYQAVRNGTYNGRRVQEE